jgi:lipopolysaccharide assembly outer membrane protein LptD (OstA)
MRKIVPLAIAAILVTIGLGLAYGQDALQTLRGERMTLRLAGQELKNVSLQADAVSFQNGDIRLTGNVRISIDRGRIVADEALFGEQDLTLTGNVRVIELTAQ